MIINLKKGFTLIELLVVIAIIAILAAILFPVFAQAREKARATSCLSSTKQIGTAILLYLDDYDEVLPATYNADEDGGANTLNNGGSYAMTTILNPYVKNNKIFACPSSGKLSDPTDIASNKLWNGILFYVNGYQTSPKSMSEITRTSEIAVCFESKFNTAYNRVTYIATEWGGWARVFHSPENWYTWCKHHNDGMNICFVDGHAKFAKTTSITSQYSGFTKSDGTYRKYTDGDLDYMPRDLGDKLAL